MEIKHRYALDQNDQLIDVDDLERSSVPAGMVFKCIGCGGDQVACLGKIRQKHFKHKNNNFSCADETYLHQLAKRVFYSEYTKCLEIRKPFYLSRQEDVICNHCEQQYRLTCDYTINVDHDLTKYFDKIFIEKHHNGFVADILLQSERNGPLFVEFAVTHRCEEEKLNSGIRIIEYVISEEFDIKPIKAHEIKSNTSRIQLYNFGSRAQKQFVFNKNCNEIINVFIISKNQKAILHEIKANADMKSQIRGNPPHIEILGRKKIWDTKKNQTLLFIKKVREAHFKNIPIKNCYICKYHGLDGVDNAVFCKIKKISISSNTAADCGQYSPMNSLEECNAVDLKNEEAARKFKYHNMIRRRYS